MNQMSETYADSIKKNLNPDEQVFDLRKIFNETKSEELVQQKEREARAQNIIIHGLPEEPDTPEGEEADIRTIKEILDAIEVAPDFESFIRLEKRNESKSRPIKLKMSTLNEKKSVMSNLSKLKQAPENFRKISVTDDYTEKEREEIRKMVNEAKNKTESQGDGKYIFKVRGSPKNGLVIRRFAVAKSTKLD